MKARLPGATPEQIAAYPGPALGAHVRVTGRQRLVVRAVGPAWRLCAPPGVGRDDPAAKWHHYTNLEEIE